MRPRPIIIGFKTVSRLSVPRLHPWVKPIGLYASTQWTSTVKANMAYNCQSARSFFFWFQWNDRDLSRQAVYLFIYDIFKRKVANNCARLRFNVQLLLIMHQQLVCCVTSLDKRNAVHAPQTQQLWKAKQTACNLDCAKWTPIIDPNKCLP